MAAPGVRLSGAAAPIEVFGVGRLALALLGGLLLACGGSATREGGGAPSGGASTSAAGSGSGAGGAAAGGQGGTPPWLTELGLESFLWFVQTHNGPYENAPPSADGGVQVSFEGMPVEATLSTHNHFGVVDVARAISFKAKASREFALLVSVKSSLDADYFGARDAGRLWPVASVMVGTDWRTFEVAFADLMPPEPSAEREDMPAFTLAFVVEQPSGPIELSLDDVHFQ